MRTCVLLVGANWDLISWTASLVVSFYHSWNTTVHYRLIGSLPMPKTASFRFERLSSCLFLALFFFSAFDVVAKINFHLIKWLLSSSVVSLPTHLFNATGENNRITGSQVDLPSLATDALLSLFSSSCRCCCCQSYLPSSFDRYQIRCPSSASHTTLWGTWWPMAFAGVTAQRRCSLITALLPTCQLLFWCILQLN